MEIMLQWLDDLEDLFFALPLLWERLRLPLLNVGLAAAAALHATNFWTMASWWVPVCGAVATTTALGWFAALVGAQLRQNVLRHSH